MFEPLTVTTTFHFVELVIIDTILIILVIVILFFLADLPRMRMMMLNWEQHQLAPSRAINIHTATLFCFMFCNVALLLIVNMMMMISMLMLGAVHI